jgi:hypothetical protein
MKTKIDLSNAALIADIQDQILTCDSWSLTMTGDSNDATAILILLAPLQRRLDACIDLKYQARRPVEIDRSKNNDVTRA